VRKIGAIFPRKFSSRLFTGSQAWKRRRTQDPLP